MHSNHSTSSFKKRRMWWKKNRKVSDKTAILPEIHAAYSPSASYGGVLNATFSRKNLQRIAQRAKSLPQRAMHPMRKVTQWIPNIITLLALSVGLTALRFEGRGDYESAVLCVFLAAILDGLDGRIARLLDYTSHFGGELDSLSDFVIFGVVPILLVHNLWLHALEAWGWCLCLMYTGAMALRLARFNTEKAPVSAWSVGLPAPAAALFAVLPLCIYFAYGVVFIPMVISMWIILLIMLMVSRQPIFVPKKFRLTPPMVFPVFVGFCVIASCFLTSFWVSCVGFIAAYGVSIAYVLMRKHFVRG